MVYKKALFNNDKTLFNKKITFFLDLNEQRHGFQFNRILFWVLLGYFSHHRWVKISFDFKVVFKYNKLKLERNTYLNILFELPTSSHLSLRFRTPTLQASDGFWNSRGAYWWLTKLKDISSVHIGQFYPVLLNFVIFYFLIYIKESRPSRNRLNFDNDYLYYPFESNKPSELIGEYLGDFASLDNFLESESSYLIWQEAQQRQYGKI